MKKTIIATLLILIIASASIFASDDSFTVTTTVSEKGQMKVSSAAMVGNTAAAYATAGDFTTKNITASGAQTIAAWVTTLSNKRTGYTLTMGATAMTNTEGVTPSYINYTVGCNSQVVTTNGGTAVAAVLIDTVTGLTGLTGKSMPISLTVDSTTFDAAVSGLHTGTVTFTFTAT
ncbi:hypothetical protein [Sphaerochaeta sp. PS]|uniref:hypothetical protein n=1 Tax=Sphaerochaeta sp. PS TaxID=3076336 RepID=UPI0028A460D5|nr:hypothetical protein [Sphaerochaeta sp. PS]MDT4763276.1 hypothetical protein [Sphaerochaeta sp. PS]